MSILRLRSLASHDKVGVAVANGSIAGTTVEFGANAAAHQGGCRNRESMASRQAHRRLILSRPAGIV
jgi:hypothetical protein